MHESSYDVLDSAHHTYFAKITENEKKPSSCEFLHLLRSQRNFIQRNRCNADLKKKKKVNKHKYEITSTITRGKNYFCTATDSLKIL